MKKRQTCFTANRAYLPPKSEPVRHLEWLSSKARQPLRCNHIFSPSCLYLSAKALATTFTSFKTLDTTHQESCPDAIFSRSQKRLAFSRLHEFTSKFHSAHLRSQNIFRLQPIFTSSTLHLSLHSIVDTMGGWNQSADRDLLLAIIDGQSLKAIDWKAVAANLEGKKYEFSNEACRQVSLSRPSLGLFTSSHIT